MAGVKRRNGLELVNSQIEAAQEDVFKRKRLYDEATDHLKENCWIKERRFKLTNSSKHS